MAEGLFNYYAKKNKIDAVSLSAGIFAHGEKVSDNSLEAMKEMGIDISNHHPTQLTKDIVNKADIILTMTREHKEFLLQSGITSEKVFTISEYAGENKDISDPFGGSLEIYRQTAKEIEKQILLIKKKVENDEN